MGRRTHAPLLLKSPLYLTLRICIGSVWLVNGLVCKVLMLVPRHHEIVAKILGDEQSMLITRGIGLAEVGLALWIWSGIRPRWAAILQMLLVATMNVIEFIVANELLLWGRFNALFATLFIALVWWHEFRLRPSAQRSPAQ